jgi:hypothetical protein
MHNCPDGRQTAWCPSVFPDDDERVPRSPLAAVKSVAGPLALWRGPGHRGGLDLGRRGPLPRLRHHPPLDGVPGRHPGHRRHPGGLARLFRRRHLVLSLQLLPRRAALHLSVGLGRGRAGAGGVRRRGVSDRRPHRPDPRPGPAERRPRPPPPPCSRPAANCRPPTRKTPFAAASPSTSPRPPAARPWSGTPDASGARRWA